jgi:adenosylcobinamide-GDP ribazoletransferase
MLSAFLIAVRTLTRIPTPEPRRRMDAPMLAWSAAFYPLVGALLGLAAWGLYAVLSAVMPQSILMLLVLALWAVVTGGLHEDGLADAADAFGSQTTREGIHRVLKDSHVGTYGVLALILSMALRWQGLAHMPAAALPAALLASQVLPRAGIVTVAYVAGPATPGSGGAVAKSLRGAQVATGWVLALLLVVPFGWQLALLAGAITLVVATLCQAYFHRKIGGVTGDCLGAANQLQEIAVVLGLLLWATW